MDRLKEDNWNSNETKIRFTNAMQHCLLLREAQVTFSRRSCCNHRKWTMNQNTKAERFCARFSNTVHTRRLKRIADAAAVMFRYGFVNALFSSVILVTPFSLSSSSVLQLEKSSVALPSVSTIMITINIEKSSHTVRFTQWFSCLAFIFVAHTSTSKSTI